MTTANRPARVLIAEDNQQGAELLEAYLAETDYDTKIATNGEEALRIAHEWQPDVVLLDVMMPRLSGYEVCRALRHSPTTKNMGIVMVTALDQHSDVDRAIDLGSDDFLTKPINKAELLLRVRAMLRAVQQPTEMQRTLEYIRSVEENRS